jgi:orotate phosphoribosyltransferase
VPAGVLIALDREERGQGDRSAVQEVRERLGIPVVSVLRLRDLLAHLEATGEMATLEAVRAYRDRYGV